MAKKGLLERMGLVEKIEDETPMEYEDVEYEVEEEELPEVNTEGVSQENLIADIYAANELTDMSCSIFKAEEISKSLPATMTNEAKKASVIGILGSFNLTVDGLIYDATNRADILRAASVKIAEENTEIINRNKEEIEKAKQLIEECEKEIAKHEQIITTSTDVVEAEIKRINALNEFLGGTN